MATQLLVLRQLARTRLLEPYALTTPGSPVVSPQGTPGTSVISYAVTATNPTGESAASQVAVCVTGAATLNNTNFNQLTWAAVPGATGYNIYRTQTNGAAPTTTGQIGSTTVALTLNDTGLAGDSTV